MTQITRTPAPDTAVADRRSFLKLAGAKAVTGSAAALGAGAIAATPAAAEADGTMYRETEHVRRYYESAR